MSSKIRSIVSLLFSGFFFIVDQALKWQALRSWTQSKIFFNFFGWHPFLNPGIAFGIPIPNFLIIILTLPVIGGLLYILTHQNGTSFLKRKEGQVKNRSQDFLTWLSALLILAGALSNFIDRILYNVTIDYILVFTSIINLADILIVTGFVLYFIQVLKHKNTKVREH